MAISAFLADGTDMEVVGHGGVMLLKLGRQRMRAALLMKEDKRRLTFRFEEDEIVEAKEMNTSL